MVFEAEIVIRRADPQRLIEDFQAVTELLERRQRATPLTSAAAVCAAQQIAGDAAQRG